MDKAATREQIRRLWKPFLFFFLIIFTVVNWHFVDWQALFIFSDYRFLAAKLASFLKGAGSEGDFSFLSEKNFISIPEIGLKAPLAFAENNSQENYEEKLKEGVLYYPFSQLPDQEGRTVLLGHSASNRWPDIAYDKVFNRINELEKGDRIYLYFEGRRYIYEVERKFFLKEGGDLEQYVLPDSQKVLTLLSCWPLGSARGRIAVEASLQ